MVLETNVSLLCGVLVARAHREYVKPYVKTDKHDCRDAEMIDEGSVDAM